MDRLGPSRLVFLNSKSSIETSNTAAIARSVDAIGSVRPVSQFVTVESETSSLTASLRRNHPRSSRSRCTVGIFPLTVR